MKFSDNLNKRVDMSKVKLDVLRPWISQKITDMLNIEDDVIVEFVYNQLEEEKFPCPKKMQINLTGFLNGKNARLFMEDLWSLLLSAQDSDTGIPEEFIQAKKEEILKREEEARLQEDGGRGHRSRSRTRDKDDGGGGAGKTKPLKTAPRPMYKPEPEDYIDEEEKMIEEFIEADVPKESKKVLPAAVAPAAAAAAAAVAAAAASAGALEDAVKNESATKPTTDGLERSAKDHSASRRKSTERGKSGERNNDSRARRKSRDRSRSRTDRRASSRDRRGSSRERRSSRDRRRSRSPRRSVDRSRKRSSRSPRDKRGNDRDRRRSRSGSAARKENKNGKRL